MANTVRVQSLPTEMLAEVARSLEPRDLGAVSGLGEPWSGAAEWELARRGWALFRPGLVVRGRSPTRICVAAANQRQLRHLNPLPREVETLLVTLDVADRLEAQTLRTLLVPSVRELILYDVQLDLRAAEAILSSNLTVLRLQRGRVSRPALRLLLDHRELFAELVLVLAGSTQAYRSSGSLVPAGSSASLEAPLAISSHLQPILTSLRVVNATHLSPRDILQISELPITNLSLENCQLPSQIFNEALFKGFHYLKSLKIINCKNVDYTTCQTLIKKSKLYKLNLDLRHIIDVEQCLTSLLATDMKSLLIHYAKNSTFDDVIPSSSVRKHLLLKNYKFNILTIASLENFVKKCKCFNIKVDYISVRTIETEGSQISHKNVIN